MIRVVATLCFSLTLLCPVLCLAERDGDCPDQGQASAGNCEAMSIGAVVTKPVVDTTPLALSLPSVGQFLAAESLAAGPARRPSLAAWNRATAKPPPASTRHALLQIFLF